MQVNCRCSQCKNLSVVEYEGKSIECPICGNTILEDDDERVTADYVPTVNGSLNVIGGDAIDKMLNKTDPHKMDKLLGEFMDFSNKMHNIDLDKNTVETSKAKLKDYVKFGDNYWQVISIKENEMLLTSKEGVIIEWEYRSDESTGYSRDDVFKFTDWENCVYRKYLNSYYYNKTFSDLDKELIVPHNNDNVFLLTKEEVLKFYPNEEERITENYTIIGEFKRPWLLRIDEKEPGVKYAVDEDGEIDVLEEGYCIDYFRPTIWIKR